MLIEEILPVRDCVIDVDFNKSCLVVVKISFGYHSTAKIVEFTVSSKRRVYHDYKHQVGPRYNEVFRIPKAGTYTIAYKIISADDDELYKIKIKAC